MKGNSHNRVGSAGLNQQGIELADRGWLEEALRAFDRAIELDGEAPFPRINRASVLLEQGDYVEALHDLLDAVRLAPDEPTTHYHLGMFLSRYGSNLAISELQTSLVQDPEQIDALIQLGSIHAERGENTEAEESFQAAREIDDLDPLVNRELGVLMLEQGKVHQAITHLRFAREQIPEDTDITVDLGMAYIQAGFYEKAERLLREALRTDPDNLHAHYNLAAVYTDWEKTDLAVDHLRQAAALGAHRVRDWLLEDRMFDKLRTDRRFIQLVKGRNPSDGG